MAALRAPDGCAWDRAQTFESIAPYTLEEAAEVADAIARRDLPDLCEELGDLLLQVVFHARMAEEQGAFDFGDVVEAITAKLIRRHPHVFGSARDLAPDAVKRIWNEIKAQEKAERAARRGDEAPSSSLLADVPAALPALGRSVALQAKAGTVGFDWNDARTVVAKIHEESDEIAAELDRDDQDAKIDEIGDLLFAVTNLARHLKVDPEVALRRANAKFERRFASIEAALAAAGKTPAESSLEEMDALWDAAKAAERTPA
jgi:ATP diphosphatase